MNFGSMLLYWIVIKPLSILPYRMLYRVSDVLFVFLYYIIPYRKKIVLDNLSRSFPEKDKEWIQMTARKFYRHFADLIVESLKNFSISQSEAQEHLKSLNPELLNRFYDEGKSLILCGGHIANWELWAVAAPPHLRHKLVGIYRELTNAFFDEKMRESRSKYGLVMIPTYSVSEYLKTNVTQLNAPIFAIDQSPSNPNKSVWIQFMGRETAAFFGAEKYAKDLNRPVIFGHLSKIKRGYYEVRYEVVTENPHDFGYGGITQRLHELLEADIRATPEFWLWSHKRWKHRPPGHTKAPPLP